MRQSDYDESRIEEHPMEKAGCPDAVGWASDSDARELFGLELDVGDFLAVDLIANFAQDDRGGRVAQRWIIDLRDYLGGDEDADRDLETAEHVSCLPENSIGAAAPQACDVVHLHEAAEHAGMTLFFDYQHPDRFRIGGVAGARGPRFRVAHQMPSFGVLAELEDLDRMSDRGAVGVGQVGTDMPRDAHRDRSIPSEVVDPVLARFHDSSLGFRGNAEPSPPTVGRGRLRVRPGESLRGGGPLDGRGGRSL